MTLLEFVGNVSNLFGTFGGIAAIALWFAERRTRKSQAEEVTVLLSIQGERRQLVLPLEILRRDVSRAELLGRIGMIPMRKAGSRFALREIGSPATMRAINAVVRGETSVLVIPATSEEVEQFDL